MTAEDIRQLQKLLREELKSFARREDLEAFATKEDLKAFPTKEDLKQELARYATKEDLKQELARYATKDDLEIALTKAEKKIISEVGDFILDQVNPQLDKKVEKSEFEKFKQQLRSLG